MVGRDVESPDLALRIDHECGWIIAGNALELRQSQERRQVLEVLRKSGAEHMSLKDISARSEGSYKTTAKLVAKLQDEGLIGKSKRGEYFLRNVE